MNPRFIIIRSIPTQDPAQVRLPKYDHVVETFPSDCADQPLDVWVLPRRSGSGRLVPNAQGTQAPPPVAGKTFAMPAHRRLGADDAESIKNARVATIEPDEQSAVDPTNLPNLSLL